MLDLDKIKFQRSTEELLKFSIINIDKPSGPTSFQVSHLIKNLLNINKTSHFGTLDPQVSGVLPTALSRACRLNEYFMHKDKTYIGIMRLHSSVSDEILKKEIKNFIGKIIQLPPIRSRVKRAERVREIKTFKIIEKDNKDILFEAQVEAGTYIRKLIHDLGQKIGGAHMLELRRIKASIFSEENSVNLYEFEKAVEEYKKGNDAQLKNMLIPAEFCIEQVMPIIQIKENSLNQLLTGKPLMKSDIINSLPQENIFAIFNNNKFVAIMKKSEEKDIIARPEFVLN